MTKTTNFEISKKLIEIGYTGKTDLETLLDALPSRINLEHKSTSRKINLSYDSIRYGDNYFFVKKQPNESLADIAGRMLILLHEENLIKF
jgi:hypothetical protein